MKSYLCLILFGISCSCLICHLIYSYDPGASQLRTTFYSTHKNLNYSREQKWAELVERYRIDKASKTGYISDIRKEMHIDILVETVVSTPWAAATQLRTTLNSTHKCPSYSHEQYGHHESSVYPRIHFYWSSKKTENPLSAIWFIHMTHLRPNSVPLLIRLTRT